MQLSDGICAEDGVTQRFSWTLFSFFLFFFPAEDAGMNFVRGLKSDRAAPSAQILTLWPLWPRLLLIIPDLAVFNPVIQTTAPILLQFLPLTVSQTSSRAENTAPLL